MILEEHGTGKGISRTKFLKEGENCDIPDVGNPSCICAIHGFGDEYM